jgi:hypothetical protein
MIFKIEQDNKLKKIKIPPKEENWFIKKNKNGKIKYIKKELKDLPDLEKNIKSKLFYILNDDGNIIVDMERTINSWIEDKYKQIGNYIYFYYPQDKQNSDLADKLYYENLLKSKTDEENNLVYNNLEELVVRKVIEFKNGKTLEEVVEDIPEEDREAFTQLIKVAIRVSWVQECKGELKKAIEEQREPKYPPYPVF